jgi:hypothetical protein
MIFPVEGKARGQFGFLDQITFSFGMEGVSQEYGKMNLT